MATSYKEIYSRAASLINSYKITHAVEDSPITFFRVMYPFLLNAFGQITKPDELSEYLIHRKEPEHLIEDFATDGISGEFRLSFEVETNSMENVFFDVYLDGAKLVEGDHYYYDVDNNSIVLDEVPIKDSKVIVEYYYCGEIIGTDSDSIEVNLRDYSIQLIASFMIRNWLEKAKNRELMIQANISPKDYQMFSPANALKENRELYKLAYNNSYSEQSAFDWNLRYAQAKYGRSYNLVAEVKRK